MLGSPTSCSSLQTSNTMPLIGIKFQLFPKKITSTKRPQIPNPAARACSEVPARKCMTASGCPCIPSRLRTIEVDTPRQQVNLNLMKYTHELLRSGLLDLIKESEPSSVVGTSKRLEGEAGNNTPGRRVPVARGTTG